MIEGSAPKCIRFYVHALIVTTSWSGPDGPEKLMEDHRPAVVRLICILFRVHAQLLVLIYERSKSIVVFRFCPPLSVPFFLVCQ